MDAIKDLTNITNMYIFFYNPRAAARLTNIDSLNPVLLSKPGLTRLYLHFGNNAIVDAS